MNPVDLSSGESLLVLFFMKFGLVALILNMVVFESGSQSEQMLTTRTRPLTRPQPQRDVCFTAGSPASLLLLLVLCFHVDVHAVFDVSWCYSATRRPTGVLRAFQWRRKET